jgi:hypothetical protein
MNTTTKQTNSEQEWPLSAGLFYQQRLSEFTLNILQELTALIDVRLVRTFSQLLITLLRFRHRNNGLLLSELGEHLLSARQAPAGTKRISNLLRCPHWSHTLIQKGIQAKAQAFYEQLHQQGHPVLVLWDESVMEKPETLANHDLGAVRSSKARRLKRIRPGYFNPPAANQSACRDWNGWPCYWQGPVEPLVCISLSGGLDAVNTLANAQT